MKKEYWKVSDQQVLEKTGKKISDWIGILDDFKAGEKKSNDVVLFCKMSMLCRVIGQEH
jgi:hypothetical protein